MDFGDVIKGLKQEPRRRYCRAGWNGKSQYISIMDQGMAGEVDVPFIYIKTVQNTKVPWLASATDLLAEDWVDYNGI